MKNKYLLYSLLFFVLCGCTNVSNKIKGFFFTNDPKKIQPEGTYVAKDKSFYEALSFKGKNTVVIHAIFGIDFPTEYEKDEEFLRVKTDKSDLLFEIISEDTLRGEGFAKGLYIKE